MNLLHFVLLLLVGLCICHLQVNDAGMSQESMLEFSEESHCSLHSDDALGTSLIMMLRPQGLHKKQAHADSSKHLSHTFQFSSGMSNTSHLVTHVIPVSNGSSNTSHLVQSENSQLPETSLRSSHVLFTSKASLQSTTQNTNLLQSTHGVGKGGKGGGHAHLHHTTLPPEAVLDESHNEAEKDEDADEEVPRKVPVTLGPTVVPGAVPAIDVSQGFHTYKDRWKLCVVMLGMMYSFYRFGRLVFELFGAWQAVKSKRKIDSDTATTRQEEFSIFLEYCKYRFDYWIAWTSGAKSMFILLISLIIMMLGAKAYCHFVGERFTTSIWKSFVWLVAPDGGIEEETVAGSVLGASMSICGLIIFAILLTVLQETFLGYLERLSAGESPVMETGHIVIIGMTEDMIPVIQELCMAYESAGGCVIAVSTNKCSKPEMEEKINASNIDLMGSRVVVRFGHPHRAASLKHVAADTAKLIIVMPDFRKIKELRDASVLHTLITLHGEGWPIGGRVIAVCSLVRNRPIFDQMGGSRTQVVMLDKFLAKLMVQCSRHVGICTIFTKTFGFQGSEFYIQTVPHHLAGKTFYEASFYFPRAVLVGVKDPVSEKEYSEQQKDSKKGHVDFCPSKEYILSHKEEIILLAEDTNGAIPDKKPFVEISNRSSEHLQMCRHEIARHVQKPETIMIFGWNKLLGQILLELESLCAKDSTVVILSAEDPDMRRSYIEKVQERDGARLVNLKTIIHVEGQLGSRFQLDELPISVTNASRIFILAADDETDQHPDACTLTMVLQIQDILRKNGQAPRSIPIIPEIRDSTLDNKQKSALQITDFINLTGLPSQVLAMVAYQPRILHVLEEIISEEATVHFAVRHLQDYIAPGAAIPESISFLEARDMGHSFGDMVIGWSQHWDKKPIHGFEHHAGEVDPKIVEWTINPEDKISARPFSHLDKLVVMTKNI